MNNRTGTLAVIICGLLLTALIARKSELVWLIFPFLAYFGAGILLTPATEEIRLRARRTVSLLERQISSLIEVEVYVVNEGKKNLNLCLKDPLLPGTKIIQGQLSEQLNLAPGEEAALKYTIEAARGVFTWEHVYAVTADPFGIIEKELKIEASARIIAWPQFKKNRASTLYPWKTLSAPGSVPTRMGGSGTDFFGIRDYHPGDPLKSLDWRLTARYPHRFFSREFVQEKTADIMLLLDARSRTNLKIDGEELFEFEVNVTASLAEMFLRQGQRLGLLIFGESIVQRLPDYGKVQRNRILDCLAGAKVERRDNLHNNMHLLPLSRFPRSTMIIVISPVDASDHEFYRKLRALGFQVLLISPDTFDFAQSILNQDNLSHLALQAGQLERRLNLNILKQLSISVIDWKVHEPLSFLVRSALGRPLRVRKI